ncbi:hypothetical protein [Rhodoferax sp. PAMC 29310]|uniref:hypothetical protein n=1 Tax=Rhodoferax sp. PAMC 29310 TaxID=2822760 RepID=UPI001F0B5099|nr:hypothetical protein [Rhodoferax sp. PAMC 29310]
MKKLLSGAALAVTANAALAADVGVSVTIGEPGFYGRIVLGNVPPPRVIYTEPVIIRQRTVVGQPIYLRVPYGHEKKWSKHCSKYNACGQPVYFVQNDWYEQDYAPRYRTEHRDYRERDDRDEDQRGNRGHGNDKHRKNKDKDHGHD